MAPHVRIIRQIEVGADCIVAGIALSMCLEAHWAKNTHLGEYGTRETPFWVVDAPWWVIDAAWLFGLLVAAVVGFRGGFLGSHLTATAAFLMLIFTAANFGFWLPPVLILVLGVLHLLAVPLLGLRICLDRSGTDNVNEMANAKSP